jgi:hypothetical protein
MSREGDARHSQIGSLKLVVPYAIRSMPCQSRSLKRVLGRRSLGIHQKAIPRFRVHSKSVSLLIRY